MGDVDGTAVIVVGRLLQAVNEFRAFVELRKILLEGDLLSIALESMSGTGSVSIVVGPVGVWRWWRRFNDAIDRLLDGGVEEREMAVQVRSQLVRMRNWTVLLVGALLLLGGSIAAVA